METTTHGVLELLLVSAVGMKHAHHHLGPQRYYVTIQCGDELRTSKITRGKHRRIWWNEKFRFPLSPRECRELAKVTLKIMERDKFADDTLVGEIRVHVGEIIREGSEREFLQMRPAPYNIVLRDGTYKGELKLGLKFLSGVSSEQRPGERRQCAAAPPRRPYAVYTPFLNITLPCVPWRRFFFLCTRSNKWTAKE
ncbi:hypothetical protein ACQJBY_058679 [Aegilops geniculata]